MKKYFSLILFLTFFFTAHPLVLAGNLPTVNSYSEILGYEAQKILDAGHLRPGHFAGHEYYRRDVGSPPQVNNFDDYFHNPADTIYTLAVTLPYLSSVQQQAVKSYLQTEYQNYKPYQWTHIGSAGAPREANDVPGFVRAQFSFYYDVEATAGNYPWEGWSFNPFNYYALWKYAQVFGNANQVLVDFRTAGNQPVSYLSSTRDSAYLQARPHVLNSYIAGYYGWLGLQALAGETPSSQVQTWLSQAQSLRLTHLRAIEPKNLSAYESGGFLWLMPELGDYLYKNDLARVQFYVNEQQRLTPYWMISRADEVNRLDETSLNEGAFAHLYDTSSLFSAYAYALKANKAELEKWLDSPGLFRGDLFYIQNLVAVLSVSNALPPVPGDLNSDGKVDILDLRLAIKNFSSVFELTTVIANYGK